MTLELLTEKTTKLAAIAKILPEECLSTTQHFDSAQNAADAFTGDLESMPVKYVDRLIKEIKKDLLNLIEIKNNNISDKDLYDVLKMPWIYSRLTNPAIVLLERAINELEGSEASAVFASGLGGVSAVINQFTKGFEALEDSYNKKDGSYRILPGEKIAFMVPVYGGSNAVAKHIAKKTGREVVFITAEDFNAKGLPENTGAVFFEACTNPTLDVMPINEIVKAAKKIEAITICDNTFTPVAVKPLSIGVDFVFHSMTKAINGKSEDLGGSISGKTDEIKKLSDLHEGERMLGGAVMSPRTAVEYLSNMKNLVKRLEKYTENAKLVKEITKSFNLRTSFIEDNENFAGIRNKESLDKSISNGMLGVYFDSREIAHQFVDRMIKKGVGYCAVSLGATKTYYSISADTTSSELTPEEMEKEGVDPGYVRISCGTEKNLSSTINDVLQEMKTEDLI